MTRGREYRISIEYDRYIARESYTLGLSPARPTGGNPFLPSHLSLHTALKTMQLNIEFTFCPLVILLTFHHISSLSNPSTLTGAHTFSLFTETQKNKHDPVFSPPSSFLLLLSYVCSCPCGNGSCNFDKTSIVSTLVDPHDKEEKREDKVFPFGSCVTLLTSHHLISSSLLSSLLSSFFIPQNVINNTKHGLLDFDLPIYIFGVLFDSI